MGVPVLALFRENKIRESQYYSHSRNLNASKFMPYTVPRARQVAICIVYSMDAIQIYPTKTHGGICHFELILTTNIPSHFCHETIYTV